MQRLIVRTISKRAPILRTAASFPVLRTRLFSSCEEPLPPYEEPEWNAFDVLGVPEKFKIDEGDLKKKYRKLMNEYHPDRNRQSAADEQDEMRDKSSAVTQAYQELTSPHTRAAHLMALRGKPMDETLSQSVVGMEFLMQVMEVREEVENVEPGSDEGLRPLLAENEKRIAETCHDLENAHEIGDLDRALQLTARLQYWNRVTETIREKMESIE
eukprot:scaffold1271_cov167-Amphora_coffeaeformis.AAC.4